MRHSGSGSGVTGSNGSLPVGPFTSATATPTVITSSVSSQLALAANGSRKGFFLVNNSTQPAYVTFGSTSSTTAFTIILFGNGGAYRDDQPFWLGDVSVIWATANGDLQVTELT